MNAHNLKKKNNNKKSAIKLASLKQVLHTHSKDRLYRTIL